MGVSSGEDYIREENARRKIEIVIRYLKIVIRKTEKR